MNFENIALGGGTSALLKMGKNNCCSSQQFINFVLPLWMVKSQTSGHTNVIISPFSPEFVNSNSFNSAYIMKYTHTVQCVWLCWILPRLLGEQFISLDFKKCLCLLSFFLFLLIAPLVCITSLIFIWYFVTQCFHWKFSNISG